LQLPTSPFGSTSSADFTVSSNGSGIESLPLRLPPFQRRPCLKRSPRTGVEQLRALVGGRAPSPPSTSLTGMQPADAGLGTAAFLDAGNRMADCGAGP
jgi:hypothetical protein